MSQTIFYWHRDAQSKPDVFKDVQKNYCFGKN